MALDLFGTYGAGFDAVEMISLGDRQLAAHQENNSRSAGFGGEMSMLCRMDDARLSQA
jgi:hypothetical protein